MKRPLTTFFILAFACSICQGQTIQGKTASIGFKAGVNSSGFRLQDFANGASAKGNIDLVSGLFATLPITNTISIQPELLYSIMGGEIVRPGSVNTDQKLAYLSVPLQAKFRVARSVSILVGPQFDFLATANRKVNDESQSNKDEIEKSDFALTGGLEYSPTSKFLVSARYIHGLKNVPRDQVEGSFFNRGIQVTVGFRIGNGQPVQKKPVTRLAPIVTDEDKDGVGDLDDKCPLVAGSLKYGGCPVPDSDNDGVNDDDDQCPNEAGLANYKGCPIPDTDKDGINNEQDQCPDVAGTAVYHGCPVPDKDSDGIADEADKCPDVAGTIANQGCPVIETNTFNAGAIQFLSGSSQLTGAAAAALNEGAALLNSRKYSLLKIRISGYTDNTGKESANKIISQKRADAVKEYLVSKGVDRGRISAVGYGSESPLADNATREGRSKNRRVEFYVTQ